MPKPNQGESRDAFIERCMGDSEAASDFPNRAQRFAVCQSLWAERGNQEDKSDMSMGNQVRVNVTSRVNQSMIRREKRNGRDVIIVPSATLPDDVVMNNIKYPADEIASSFLSLNGTPAPLGHPMTPDGDFVSAIDGDGLNGFYIGAFNANARREGGRVFLDKIIDVEMASALPGGQRVLEAINQGDPIDTSTGLLCNIEMAKEGDNCDFIARNIIFDHDAILLDEPGAAGPEQGVGMMVNKALDDEGNKINAILCNIEGVDVALSEPQKVGFVHMIKSAIKEALAPERKTETNSNEVDMTDVTKPEFDALSAQVNELADVLNKLDIDSALEKALAPLTEKVETVANAQSAEADAKHAAAVERVVNKGILDEAVAKETPLVALEAMLNAKGQAAPILGGFSNAKASDGGYTILED